MLDNKIIFEDDKGNQEEFNVVLTFDDPDTNKKYVIVEKLDSTDDEVYVYRYDDEHNLYPIETDEEWQLASEVLDAFNEEDEN